MCRKFGLDGQETEYKSSEDDDHSGSDGRKDYSGVSSKIKKMLNQQDEDGETIMVSPVHCSCAFESCSTGMHASS
jgi:hypothetical protein